MKELGFIVYNLKKHDRLKIDEIKSNILLSIETGPILQKGLSGKFPYNLYLLDTDRDDEENAKNNSESINIEKEEVKNSICIDGENFYFLECKEVFLNTEVSGEKPLEVQEATYDNLNLEFGTKVRKEMILKRDISGYVKKDKRSNAEFLKEMNIDITDEILPNSNGPNFYILENIFSPLLLLKLQKKKMNIEETHEYLKTIEDKYTREKKAEFLLLHSFLTVYYMKVIQPDKLLEVKYITEDFLEIIKDFTIDKIFTPIGRDKVIAYIFILTLFIFDHVIPEKNLPLLEINVQKRNSILQTLGCTYCISSKTYYRDNEPKKSYLAKKKRRR